MSRLGEASVLVGRRLAQGQAGLCQAKQRSLRCINDPESTTRTVVMSWLCGTMLQGSTLEAGERAVTTVPPVRRWTILIVQFACYSVVGGIAFLADLVASIALLAIGAPILMAFSSGYVVGFVVNFVFSKLLAFRAGRFSHGVELTHLVLVNLIGFAMTVLMIRLFMMIPSVSPIFAKLVVTPIVLIWNFLGRRFFVFHKEMPVMTAALAAAVVNRFEST
jgi:putative flippase GtrA